MPPDQSQELFQAALKAMEQEQMQLAANLLQEAIQLLPEPDAHDTFVFNLHYHLGLCYTEMGEAAAALAAYRAAGQTCPQPELAWLPHNGQAIALSDMDKIPESIAQYEAALASCTEALPRYNICLQLADAYLELTDLEIAIHYQLQALELAKANDWPEDLMYTYRELGDLYIEFERTAQAVTLLSEALEQARRMDLPDWERLFLGNLSTAYLNSGQLDQARQLAEQLLEIYQTSGVIDDATTAYNNLAMYYRAKGDYQKGIEYLHRAIAIDDDEESTAIEYRNLSRFYEEAGDWNAATHYLLLALETVERAELWEKLVKYRMQAGDLYFERENYKLAIQYYEACLEAYTRYPKGDGYIEAMTHLGSCYSRLDEFEKGLEIYRQAVTEVEKLQVTDRTLSILYGAMAGAYLREDFFEEAEKYYRLSRELEGPTADIVALFNYGAFFYMTGNYQEAEGYLEQAIDQFERQRQTMALFDRKLFDDRYGYLYEYRCAIEARQGNGLEALRAIEHLKARATLEEFSKELPSNWLPELLAELPSDKAVLYFVNTQHNSPLVFCLTRGKITTAFLSLSDFRDTLAKFEDPLDRYWAGLRTLETDGSFYARSPIPHPGWFDLVVLYYRHRLLLDPRLWPAKRRRTEELAGRLYDYLILPFAEQLEGKKDLLIIPDRSLTLLPFESLINRQQTFLVEQYNIRYLPNLSHAYLLSGSLPDFERTALLMGVTQYEPLPKDERTSLERVQELPQLRMRVREALREKESLEAYFAYIGVRNWFDLPHIHRELAAIQSVFPDGKMLVDQALTPAGIHALNRSGDLAGYRILHFANHGIAVPAVPELSALVLSPDLNGDRYLTADAISQLNISAELVNLSACETGLGEMIPSIGLQGLTQAFFTAGARSVQVSLWEIEDAVTAQFMERFYQLLLELEWDYAAALAAVKRQCIRGNLGPLLENPIYWASFIRFGC